MLNIEKDMPVRIGVIGVGEYGTLHLNVYKQLERTNRTALVAAMARSKQSAQRVEKEFNIRAYTDYKAMLDRNNLDAVAVATPDHLHREIVLEAVARGLHVIVEKPMDVTVAGCLAMNRAAEKHNVLLQVDFHKHFDPHILAIKTALDSGEIGRLQYGYVCMENILITAIPNIAGWIQDTSPSWLLGIHFYDVLNWLAGDDPVRVYATGTKRKLKQTGRDTWDSIQAKIEYADGFSVSVDTSWILPEHFENRVNQEIRLVGDDGIIEADLQDRGLRMASGSTPSSTLNPDYISSVSSASGTRYSGYAVDSMINFVENVATLKAGLTLADIAGTYPSGKDGLKATAIAEAVDKSLEKHDPVGIEKVWS